MIETNTHKIGDLVCFCEEDQIIGSIVSFDSLLYKVSWASNVFSNIPDTKVKDTTFHTSNSISLMKKILAKVTEGI